LLAHTEMGMLDSEIRLQGTSSNGNDGIQRRAAE
jgi:hypothetical protein